MRQRTCGSGAAFARIRLVLRKLPNVCAFMALGLLLCSYALAAPRDNAARKKIEEAIYVHFLKTDFDTAEGLLLGTIRACEDKCSPAVKANAWMYVGVVRGSGRNDIAGAEEAFSEAKKLDPKVQLDGEVANDPVKAAFARVVGTGEAPPEETGEPTAPPQAEGAMKCSLSVSEVQTQRPIPIACESEETLETTKLFYKTMMGGWTSVPMKPEVGIWHATIPCSATRSEGPLRWYVSGFDADGEVVDQLGSQQDPSEISLVEETDEDPPAFPDEEPPARCGAGSGGGASMSACGGWGDPCGAGDCCDAGLACQAGTCQPAECEKDSDCESGTCRDRQCEDSGGGPKLNWVGVHVGMDWAYMSGDATCSAEQRDNNYTCYDSGAQYPAPGSGREPNVNTGNVVPGFVASSLRFMASYERLFGPFGIEGRLGYALRLGSIPDPEAAFLPVHVEVRGKWWLFGSQAFGKPGVRPFIHVGGGIAQINSTVGNVEVFDCDATDSACVNSAVPSRLLQVRRIDNLQVTKSFGTSFATFGGGLMYALQPNHGPVFNLSALILFPSVGVVVEPSLGYALGF